MTYTLLDVKRQLRAGKWAWPGGYPMYFVTSDGQALSMEAARDEWSCIVAAHLANDTGSGWHVFGADINYEDSSLYCSHTGNRIESAYAEDEVGRVLTDHYRDGAP